MDIPVPEKSSCEHRRRLATGRSIVGAIRDGSLQFVSFRRNKVSVRVVFVAIWQMSCVGKIVTIRSIVVVVRFSVHMTRSPNLFRGRPGRNLPRLRSVAQDFHSLLPVDCWSCTKVPIMRKVLIFLLLYSCTRVEQNRVVKS